MLDLVIVRVIFILVLTFSAYTLHPFQTSPIVAAAGGAVFGVCIIFFEIRLETRQPQTADRRRHRLGSRHRRRLSDVAGARARPRPSRFSRSASCFADDVRRPDRRREEGRHAEPRGAGRHLRRREKSSKKSFKILDTSVIIDGRIADIAETGFLDGVLVIPQFVLRELQLVADSADSMKRNRGRRGLDILQRIQKMAHLNVQIVEEDFPQVREVDMKLIELAKVYDCKVITNDFNLNKVAQLHGVEVLNINELANSLKPIVLPGETMRVFILKEGKEYNQGVAYLDDGTMVVVDNAKKMISKTIDISVTSVLQTTAGKMIFGKFDERDARRRRRRRRHDRPRAQERSAADDAASGPRKPR